MNAEHAAKLVVARQLAADARREQGIADVVAFRMMLVRDRELAYALARRREDGAQVEEMTRLRVERSALWANAPHTTDAAWRAARECGAIS